MVETNIDRIDNSGFWNWLTRIDHQRFSVIISDKMMITTNIIFHLEKEKMRMGMWTRMEAKKKTDLECQLWMNELNDIFHCF